MKIILFYHSLISDWNHGNAHFLRGYMSSLQKLGHEVILYEPVNGWSLQSLIEDVGISAVTDFEQQFPHLKYRFYDPENSDLNQILKGVDLVIVHEWNPHSLIHEIGEHRKHHEYVLLFHDTHHRGVSSPDDMSKYDLTGYDGVLAFGDQLKKVYLKNQWHSKVWTWHEAADTDTYFPEIQEKQGDLVWIGNWGDNERTAELMEFLILPIKELGLKAKFYGVRYPELALIALKDAGIEYGGYLPAYKVSEVFAQYKMTVHVPRRFYRYQLKGIPTIRPFEAMACKIPLLCAPWSDVEELFDASNDYLMAHSTHEMKEVMLQVLHEEEQTKVRIEHAYQTIVAKHTCDIRATELLNIYESCIKEIQT
jgi:spore maturation protein CgeB